MTTKTFECQNCGEDITVNLADVPHKYNTIECSNCKSQYTIDLDGEFIDGMWKDLSKLHLI